MNSDSIWRRTWLQSATVLSAIGGTALSAADPAQRRLPKHRWVVDKQRTILQPEDVGLKQPQIFQPEGLTKAKNGDLLLAVCSQNTAHTIIMRSSDRGQTWRRVGSLKNKGGGSTEGMIALRSGRLVIICYRPQGKATKIRRGSEYYVPGASNFRFQYLRSVQYGAYSDDEGRTWRYTSPIKVTPFQAASFVSSSQIFETKDGTLVASFYGHLNNQELESGVGSVGVIRSHDAGQTWGDVSIVCSGQPGSGHWYNESSVMPLNDGRWLCMVRMNPNNEHGKTPLVMKRCYSRDAGRTWTYPVPTRFRGGEPAVSTLPDGGIICSQTAGWTIDLKIREDRVDVTRYGVLDRGKLLYEVSYDAGLTWDYWGDLYRAEKDSKQHNGSTILQVLDKDNLLAVYHCGQKSLSKRFGSRARIIGATWLKRVPSDHPLAKGLKYS